jgi:hypothetical protein
MSVWGWIVAVLAGLGILVLLGFGGEGRDSAGRAREGIDERAAQPLVAMSALDPLAPMTVVLEQDELARSQVPPEAAALLTEVRDLVASAKDLPPDQAQAALAQARAKLDVARVQMAAAAHSTLPPETAALLTEVRDLVASAKNRPPEQAQPALEQAREKLDLARQQIAAAARAESNDVVKIRLLRLHRMLDAVRAQIEARIDRPRVTGPPPATPVGGA